MAESKTERLATPELVVARAKELRRAGYTVLVSEAGCGHWNGYCAFRTDRPEEPHINIECEVRLQGNPHAVYELDS